MLFMLQTVPLSFTFTFYGHEVKQITIATGGTVLSLFLIISITVLACVAVAPSLVKDNLGLSHSLTEV